MIVSIGNEKVATSVYRYAAWRTQAGVGSQTAITAETECPSACHRSDNPISRDPADTIITKISDEKVATPIQHRPAGRKQRGVGSRAAIAIKTELVVTRHGGDNLCMHGERGPTSNQQ